MAARRRTTPAKPRSATTATASRAAVRTWTRGLEAILRIVELNSQRISRLEDVFALQLKQRSEVTDSLKELHALLRPRRTPAVKARQKR